jgi:hypothetical protein
MKTMILKVVKCGEMFSVRSEKAEGGSLNKRILVLQEFGGKYENQYMVSTLGTAATLQFYDGDIVLVTLRFQAHEHNGQTFQDITATEILKMS